MAMTTASISLRSRSLRKSGYGFGFAAFRSDCFECCFQSIRIKVADGDDLNARHVQHILQEEGAAITDSDEGDADGVVREIAR